jgi:HlyD family secretion protein
MRNWLIAFVAASAVCAISYGVIHWNGRDNVSTRIPAALQLPVVLADTSTNPSAPNQSAKSQVIRVTGQTDAVKFANVAAPKLAGPEGERPLILTKLVEHGVFVRRGQLMGTIDAGALKDHMDDVWNWVEQTEVDIEKRRAEQAVESETIQQTLRVAKADWDKAKLDARTADLKTAVEREILQLNVEEAAARYQQLQRDVETKKRTHVHEIRILEYTKMRHMRHFKRHEVDLTHFTMSAPIDGRAIVQQQWSGDEYRVIRVGDRVFPAQPFVKVVDSSTMILRGSVNQSDSGRIRLGQPAKLTFDAFPGVVLPGKVRQIGAIAKRSWRQQFFIRNIDVDIAIDGSDPKIIPDLSGAADVKLADGSQGL